MEKGEDPLSAAKRELEEETGFTAKNWKHLGDYYLSPGFCDELMHFYWAEDLTEGEVNFDEDECCERFSVSADGFEDLAKSAPILDAKTRLVYELSKPLWVASKI